LGAQGTICAGGRYDGLVAQIGGSSKYSAPACGFAMGVERLLTLMQECGAAVSPPIMDAYVVHQGEEATNFAWKTVEFLRSNGLKVMLHCGGGSFKSQMKKADASGARFALIIGDQEAQVEAISIKPLREAACQVSVGLGEVVDLLKKPFKRPSEVV
jgi:histidyl-tRNA synthetase